MDIKRIVTCLCGIWAFGLGLRICVSLAYADGVYLFYTNTPVYFFWDFGPLCLLGAATVAINIHDYYRVLCVRHLGCVIRNEG